MSTSRFCSLPRLGPRADMKGIATNARSRSVPSAAPFEVDAPGHHDFLTLKVHTVSAAAGYTR